MKKPSCYVIICQMLPEKPCKDQDEFLIQDVKERFAQSASRHFGNDVVYSFISGGFSYGGAILGKSDIDVVVVLRNDAKSKDPKSFRSKVSKFVDDYLEIHHDFGYQPSTFFPGEYISEEQVVDAISGRGFQASSTNKLYLDIVTDSYYLEDSERWYRAWLSQSAMSLFIGGDRSTFLRNKRDAWATVLAFNLLLYNRNQFRSSDFIDYLISNPNKKAGTGIHNRYRTFRDKESAHILLGLQTLETSGILIFSGSYCIVDKEVLSAWEAEVATAINNGSIRKSQFLLNMEETLELANETKQKWKTIYERFNS